VGLTYAFGTNRTTVFKASYARYAEALGTNTTGQTNPTNAVSYAYYGWNDANGDNLAQVNEVDLAGGLLQSRNFDPANPSATVSPNTFAADFHAPKTWEAVAGIDHELMPAFAVGVAYTHRTFTDQAFRTPTGVTAADYAQYLTINGSLPGSLGGGAFAEPVYELAACQADPAGCSVPPGYLWSNREGYNTTYDGVDLTLTKRLSNKWMMRGNFSYNLNKQHVDNIATGCVDPTNTVPGQSADTGNPQTAYTAESCADGAFVATRSTGSGAKDSVFLNSKWQFYLNAMYQLPWNFNIATSFFGRQGYPVVPFVRVAGDDGYVRDVVVRGVDDLRYDNVYELDFRIEKLIPITQTANVTLSLDLFNALNDGTILQRFNRIGDYDPDSGTVAPRGNAGNIKEIQSPRVLRFGARISF
jgi:hypothetical protein